MRESQGKAVARAYFYQSFLPSCLTASQLQHGNFLLLLGEQPRELPYLQELRVPMNQIWSVENQHAIFLKQLQFREQGHLPISLYYGDMAEYVQYLLHENKEFLVLGLDVEGSFLNQLDPAMTSVMLFCWRAPQSVVATYSSVGRDRFMVWEGLKSLALFLAIAPKQTAEFLAVLSLRYERAGFTEPVSMVLRDLFWIRSHLEHTLMASVVVGAVPGSFYRECAQLQESLWQAVKKQRRFPLSMGFLQACVKSWLKDNRIAFGNHFNKNRSLGLSWDTLAHVVYNAEHPWSQLCYFAKFRNDGNLISCKVWLLQVLELFMRQPLLYIARSGKTYELDGRVRDLSELASVALLKGNNRTDRKGDREIYRLFKPRQLEARTLVPHVRGITQTILAIRKSNGYHGNSM